MRFVLRKQGWPITQQSLNMTHCNYRSKNSNKNLHDSIDMDKIFDEIQHLFMVKFSKNKYKNICQHNTGHR